MDKPSGKKADFKQSAAEPKRNVDAIGVDVWIEDHSVRSAWKETAERDAATNARVIHQQEMQPEFIFVGVRDRFRGREGE